MLAATPISRFDLPWWRTRHEAKLAELRTHPADLIFLGDSITQDYEVSGPPEWRDFVPVWQHFYGDRNAGVKDSFGNQWWFATHIEDVSDAEIAKRAQALKK